MKERLLTGWTLHHWLYLFLGGMIMTQAITEQQWMIMIFGGYFTAMAVFNFGCAAGSCYGGTCNTNSERKSDDDSLNTDFEEIKNK